LVMKQVEELTEHFNYLADRWENEKEYEDFKDYDRYIKEKMPEGYEVKEFTSSPFVLKVEYKDKKITLTAEEEKTLIEITT